MHTRSMRRSKIQGYLAHLKSSQCRGQKRCSTKKGCKKTRAGKRKSYCRKSRNRHV